MRLYVTEDIQNIDGGYTSVMVRNPSVDYSAPCSNPKCKGYGTRNQYGRDETCRICGSPIAWEREVKHGYL